jgi:methylmalonyl-CoA mutase C-terminal domain/subunit
MEVIYTGLHWTPEMIVETAIQENVDAIGLSVLSGAHMTIFPKIQAVLKNKGLEEILLFGGGVIPPDDVTALKKMGIDGIFPPGSKMQAIIDYLKSELSGRE